MPITTINQYAWYQDKSASSINLVMEQNGTIAQMNSFSDLRTGDIIFVAVAFDNLSSTTPTLSTIFYGTGGTNPTNNGWNIYNGNSAQSAASGAAKGAFAWCRLTSDGVISQITLQLSAGTLARACTAHVLRGPCSDPTVLQAFSTSVNSATPNIPVDGAFVACAVSEQNTSISWSGSVTNAETFGNRSISTSGGGSAANVAAGSIVLTHANAGATPGAVTAGISDGAFMAFHVAPGSTAGSATFTGSTGTATASSAGANTAALTGDANFTGAVSSNTASGGTGALVRSVNATLTLNTGAATASGLVGAFSNATPATFSGAVGTATAS